MLVAPSLPAALESEPSLRYAFVLEASASADLAALGACLATPVEVTTGSRAQVEQEARLRGVATAARWVATWTAPPPTPTPDVLHSHPKGTARGAGFTRRPHALSPCRVE